MPRILNLDALTPDFETKSREKGEKDFHLWVYTARIPTCSHTNTHANDAHVQFVLRHFFFGGE